VGNCSPYPDLRSPVVRRSPPQLRRGGARRQGGADCDLHFGFRENHPVARRATPPDSGGEFSISAGGAMKITKIETISFDPVPNAAWEEGHPRSRQALPVNLWVRVHTDEGLVGLGETYYVLRAVNAVIHDIFAPLLIGRDPLDIENHWNNLFSLVNFFGFAGAEMRAISAVDIALWDLAGQYAGMPIYNLLGGRSRDRILIYNTCVNWGKHLDYQAWMEGHAGELAADLLKHGTKAMKLWPFDRFGATLAGPVQPVGNVPSCRPLQSARVLAHYLDNENLKRGLEIVADIRRTMGDKIQIAIEGHARWDLTTALRIARALEPYDIMWLEEIMPPDNAEAYVRLKSATKVPICQSERIFTRYGFRQFIDKNAADIIMPDVSWCGGITEVRKIASMADTYYLPITLHDCIGPGPCGHLPT
jgi:galactonate dehydratase